MCWEKYWKLYTVLYYSGVHLLYMMYFKMSCVLLLAVCIVVVVLYVLL